jgi:putative addiction module component (TIGR02574 family)
MIYEQISELHSLSREEKTALATELLHEASKPGPGEPDPEVTALLRQRQAEYRANPEATFTWEQVKARALGTNG